MSGSTSSKAQNSGADASVEPALSVPLSCSVRQTSRSLSSTAILYYSVYYFYSSPSPYTPSYPFLSLSFHFRLSTLSSPAPFFSTIVAVVRKTLGILLSPALPPLPFQPVCSQTLPAAFHASLPSLPFPFALPLLLPLA